MNAYQVISEELNEEMFRNFALSVDPPETYCIVKLVVARTHSHARWLAWKSDRSFSGVFNEAPKFSVRIFGHNIPGPARLVTTDPDFQIGWGVFFPADKFEVAGEWDKYRAELKAWDAKHEPDAGVQS